MGKIIGVSTIDDYISMRTAASTLAKDSASLIETILDVVSAIDPTNPDYVELFNSDEGMSSMA